MNRRRHSAFERNKYNDNVYPLDTNTKKMVVGGNYFSSRGSNRLAWCMVCIFVVLFLIFLLATIGLAILLLFNPRFAFSKANKNSESLQWPSPSQSLLGKYQKAAIVTDNGLCSEVGRNILLRGGNAVEAMIAAMFCIGTVNPQSSGIGGGFMMTIYNSTTKKCTTINARETAPEAASENMYNNDTNASLIGYRAIAVPGQVHGFWNAFKRFGSGKVSWKELIEPSIKLCKDGFPVSRETQNALESKKHIIGTSESALNSFINNVTGQLYKEGEIMKLPKLASLLEQLASSSDPVDLFYNGILARDMANEMDHFGGLITARDLKQYRSIINEDNIINEHLPNGLAICGPPPPSSFAVTQSIISVMGALYANAEDPQSLLHDPLTYQRLIETMKFAYAQRSQLGDAAFVEEALELARNMTTPEFTNWIKSEIMDRAEEMECYTKRIRKMREDHGTSHSSAIDSQGIAVACTATINRWLGAVCESRLGFLWNNEMDDFSQPGQRNSFGYAPSQTNFIRPGKRPMSSMSPSVVYERESGKARMVLGGSGGSQIISSVSEVATLALFFNRTIKEAIDWPRLHNQFSPHSTNYEAAFTKEIIQDLESRGQNMTEVTSALCWVQAISIAEDGKINANNDYRRKIISYPSGY